MWYHGVGKSECPTGEQGVESKGWRLEMETIKVRKKYQITLPAVIREAAGVYEGDFLIAEVQEDRTILLRPSRLVDADEAFFYTPEWQAAEREADEDLAAGRYDDFETMADLIADLERQEAELSASEAP